MFLELKIEDFVLILSYFCFFVLKVGIIVWYNILLSQLTKYNGCYKSITYIIVISYIII